MDFYETFRHNGKTCRFTYLAADLTDLEIQRQIYRDIMEMMECGQTSAEVKNRDYQGKIENKGATSLGFLSGRRFDVTIDTEQGRKNLSLMTLSY
jgi:hypothetical protein